MIGWYENGNKKYEGNFVREGQDGLFTFWYENGMIMSKGLWKKGVRNGLYSNYYDNGMRKFEGKYLDGNLINYNCWDELGNQKECMKNDIPISPKV